MASDLIGTFAAFRGGSGSDCEEFISNVRKAAFNVEKLNDDGWQAGYASACLSGDALRFYEGLPEETQASWKLLRTALLEKYPAPLIDVSIQIPEAAGAPGYPPIGAVVFPPESRPVRKTIEVIALWDFESAEPGDVNFRKGDRISWVDTEHEGVSEDWWLGKNERTGHWGTFPFNWVQIIQTPTQ